jgi:tRNA 2-selenouridine synthase
VLRSLVTYGAQVVDLEALACHRGSAFGALGQPPQPSHRAFQARVAAALRASRPDAPLFIEDEGEYLGSVGVPPSLFLRMRAAARVLLDTPRAARLSRLVTEYGGMPARDLAAAIRRLVPRIGRSEAASALNAVARGDIEAAIAAVLPFYDRAYAHRFALAEPVVLRCVDGTDADRAGEHISRYIARIPALLH